MRLSNLQRMTNQQSSKYRVAVAGRRGPSREIQTNSPLFAFVWQLQSRPNVARTLELYHASMLDNIAFFQQKGKKSPDYQHWKWGEGRTYFVSQLFSLGLKLHRYTANTSTLTFFVLHSEPLPEPWNTDLDSFQKLLALKCLRADKVTNAMQVRH